jgi:hypothetical protein
MENTSRSYVEILNRAPTLHRLSIQAFQPTFVEGRTICLRVFRLVSDIWESHGPITIEINTRRDMNCKPNCFYAWFLPSNK